MRCARAARDALLPAFCFPFTIIQVLCYQQPGRERHFHFQREPRTMSTPWERLEAARPPSELCPRKIKAEHGTTPRKSGERRLATNQEDKRTIATLEQTLEVVKARHDEQPGDAYEVRRKLQSDCDALKEQLEIQSCDLETFRHESRKDKESVRALREENCSLRQKIRAAEEESEKLRYYSSAEMNMFQECDELLKRKHERDAYKAMYEGLMPKYTTLDGKCKKLELVAKLDSSAVVLPLKEKLQKSEQTIAELRAQLREASQSLGQSMRLIQSKDKQRRSAEAGREESEREHKAELEACKAAHDVLAAKHSTLGEKCKKLENVDALKHWEAQKAEESIVALREAMQSHEKSNETKDGQIRSLWQLFEESEREHKTQVEACNAAKDRLSAAHVTLQGEYETLEASAKRSSEGLKASEEELRTAKASVAALKEAIQTLGRTTSMIEGQIRVFRKATEDAERERKAQIRLGKTAHGQLSAKHATQQGEYATLANAVKLKSEEVKSLKRHVHVAKGSIATLQEANRSLAEALRKNEERMRAGEKAAGDLAHEHGRRRDATTTAREEGRASRKSSGKHTVQKHASTPGGQKQVAAALLSAKLFEAEATKMLESYGKGKKVKGSVSAHLRICFITSHTPPYAKSRSFSRNANGSELEHWQAPKWSEPRSSSRRNQVRAPRSAINARNRSNPQRIGFN